MKVLVVGGGPGGLYAAALIRQAFGDAEVSVLERDPHGATYGWGVVFSEQTVSALGKADRVTYERIEAQFARWDAIDTDFRGVRMRAHGHGFSGLSRTVLLGILEDRCAELGVEVHHKRELSDRSVFAGYDLVVAADGLNSRVRQAFADTFRPSYDTRSAKYIWWGTSKRPDVFTYMVRPTKSGIFQGTVYPFTDDRSTFVIECSEKTWKTAGLAAMDEEQSKAFCEDLFADFLEGHPLLANRSLWLNFTTVRNQRWSRDNVVLLGDAAHTVHFTIGSGTKLAMEDGIALADALRKHHRIPDALAYYENGRAPVIEAFQEAAQQSLLWFESLDRHMRMPPQQFMFNFLTRSGRISYDDVRQRDARFADEFDRWFTGAAARSGPEPALIAPPPLFTPLRVGRQTVRNRAVLTIGNDLAGADAVPGAAHERAVLHRAHGGAGMVMTDIIAVSDSGRVTPCDTGLYRDDQEERWAAIVAAVHGGSGTPVMARLGHAGPRGAAAPRARGIDRPLPHGGWPLLAASARPHISRARVPKEMTRGDMDAVIGQFRAAAERAARAGFDMLELHAGHGYLLASFLSPLTNHRCDEYGGDLESRMSFPVEVFEAVKSAWPQDRPLSVCLTADDWASGGATTADAAAIARELEPRGCDLVHLVAGQTMAGSHGRYGPSFLSAYGEWLRNETGIPVMIRGRITTANEANTVIGGGRADLCIMDLPGLAEFDTRLRREHPGPESAPGADAGSPRRGKAMSAA